MANRIGMGTAMLCVLAAAGCATQMGSNSTPEDRRVTFACDGGQRLLQVRFRGDKAVMERGGTAVALIRHRTADGFLYTGGGQSLRGKGDDLTWQEGRGKPHMCHVAPPGAPKA